MPKPKKKQLTKKKPLSKPISLYGIPFKDAVEGLLKTKPPEKKNRKKK